MSLKVFEIENTELSKDFFLRIDVDYFVIKHQLNFDQSTPLKKYITFIETGKPITPDDYSSEITENIHVVVRNIVSGEMDYSKTIYLNDEKAYELKKWRIKKGDIVIAISSNCGSAFLFDGETKLNLTLSHYLCRIRVDNFYLDNKFLVYYINSKKLREYFRSVETGKTLKNLSKYYIKQLPLNCPDIEIQHNAIEQINPIENIIKQLKTTIKPASDIINEVFANEFNLDIDTIFLLDKNKIFETNFGYFSPNNENIRFSFRWNQLEKIQTRMYQNINCVEYLGKYIVSTKNGWSPECNENESNYKVLGIDSLNKNGILTFDNPKFTDETKNNLEAFIVQKGDFFVSRGNTTDLVALASIATTIEEDDFIYPDLMIKVIIDESKLNKEYLAFVFNSFFGRFYFKYAAKGKNQSMVKISSKELHDFLFPVPDLKIQQRIVNEIKAGFDKQEKINNKVEQYKLKIDEIIERAIKFY